MFVSSRPFLVFDHFRVPYEVGPSDGPPDPYREEWAALAPRAAPERSIRWPRFAAGPVPPPRRFHLGGLVLHARVMAEDVVRRTLTCGATEWYPGEPLTDGTQRLGSVWRNEAGGLALPFDPNEVVANFWSEGYQAGANGSLAARSRSVAVSSYYRVRPLIPRQVQISARRLYSRIQARIAFPRWPVEPSLHGFYDLVLGWAAGIVDDEVPYIAPWPAGRSWALVLTHDVETDDGLRRIPALRDIELASGFRSSWNLVPRRYAVPDDTVAALKAHGFEVGLHGLYHDGRDLADGVFDRRLPEMRRWAQRWQASGFRSPATHRSWDTMAALPFEYDSSYPDTDPFEPQPGGCCSWLPYFNGPLVELPITMPQDHTVFVILRHRGGRIWIEKAERIRAAGGMALVLTHPDYLDHTPVGQAYEELLARFADDSSAWRALPVEVARWWQRRDRSRLERSGAGWRVVGPARDEASILTAALGRSVD